MKSFYILLLVLSVGGGPSWGASVSDEVWGALEPTPEAEKTDVESYLDTVNSWVALEAAPPSSGEDSLGRSEVILDLGASLVGMEKNSDVYRNAFMGYTTSTIDPAAGAPNYSAGNLFMGGDKSLDDAYASSAVGLGAISSSGDFMQEYKNAAEQYWKPLARPRR